MTSWIFTGFLALIYLLQTTLFANLAILGVVPDIILVCLLCYTIIFGREKGFVCALITGFIIDLLTGDFFGRHILIYVFSSALADFLTGKLFGKNFLTAALITLIVSFLGGVVMAVYMYAAKIDRNIFYLMFQTSLLYAAYNAVISIFMFFPIESLKSYSFRKE